MSLVRTIILLFLAMLTTSCSTSDKEVSIRIGTVQWPGYEPLYLARSLGYFDEKSVRLIEHTATTETIAAYRNGILDMAALTLDETLTLREQGVPLQVILVMDTSNGGDVILAKPIYKNMKDLKGKRIGVEANALGAFVLSRGLELNGMTINDVEIVPMQFGEQESAFNQGLVDAVVTFEPVRTKLLKSGANIVFDSSKIPGEIVDTLIANPDFIKNHPDAVRALLQNWFKSLDYMNKEPNDAAKRIANRLMISPEEFLASLQTIRIPDAATNHQLLGGTNPQLHATLQKLGKSMRQQSLLKQDPIIEGLVTDSMLP